MRASAVKPVRPHAGKPVQVRAAAGSAAAKPVQIVVKSVDGAETGSKELSLKVAGESAKGLVHRYLVMVQQNARQGTASTLTRGDVRGGGKKPYKQKGTGNARRGSSTSPLFVGGGISFGPKPKDWTIKMNKKERRLALATAIQSAAPDMMVVENLAETCTDRKTKSVVALLEGLGLDSDKKTLLVLKEPYEHILVAGRNLPNLFINTADAMKVFDVLNAHKIVVEESALEFLVATYSASAMAAAKDE